MKILICKNTISWHNDYDLFNKENYLKVKHTSGLTLIFNVMPEYNYTHAMIGVKYGSVNIEFKGAEDKEFTVVPQGIAHFLEHIMFENEDEENALFKFSKTGAIANAQTGFNETSYLFSCSYNFKESLKILLENITKPYFTKESIDREKDIIEKEIKMYEDDPSWIGYISALENLYHKIPLNDIAGTVESIKKITPELLYKCYDKFYNLNNMVLSIAGNFNIEDAIEIVDEVMKKSETLDVINKTYDEPSVSKIKKSTMRLELSISTVVIAFKHKPSNTIKENFELSFKYSILNEILLGKASRLFGELYQNEIIDKEVFVEVMNGNGYLNSIFSCETMYPNVINDSILNEINIMKLQGISDDQFNSAKKSIYGEYIVDMDSPKKVATNNLYGHFDELDFKNWTDVILNTSKYELENLLKDNFSEDGYTFSVVNPI